MNPLDPNIRQVEEVARALGDLRNELVFVGGCAAGLLCDSPQAAPPRVTYDVDVIAEVAALSGYHALEKRVAALEGGAVASIPLTLNGLLLARLDNGPELATTQVDLGETLLNAVSDARAASPTRSSSLRARATSAAAMGR